jgi:hypothetical protein
MIEVDLLVYYLQKNDILNLSQLPMNFLEYKEKTEIKIGKRTYLFVFTQLILS